MYFSDDHQYIVQTDQWGIWLDSRQLKTPARNNFAVPSEPLAMAVAAEWEYQVL